MTLSQRFYITTPIFYPNGKPHIGHAYTDIMADVFARFHRLEGREVFFLSGTDEHGLKMQRNAEAEKISPKELADKNSAIFRRLLDKLDCSYTCFIRTTESRHYLACQALWNKMLESGDIYLGEYKGWYSVRQEAYFDEKETHKGEDGIRREPLGSPVEWNEEKTWFFRLSRYQEPLLELYKKQPNLIAPPERRNEVIRFIEEGLKDLSISRSSFTWGIPVPQDPGSILYVWVDALTNYLTALGYPEKETKDWEFWPPVHFIGKDILRFHAVYWPAFLLSANLPLPRTIFAHGFLFNKGEKMSKSVGNIIEPFDLIEHYGLDPLRYFLIREIPFGQDGCYTHEAIVQRINSDLANDLGNLLQRSLSIIAKECNGKLFPPSDQTQEDLNLFALSLSTLDSVRASMNNYAPHTALTKIFALISQTNRYFAAQKPWALKKTDQKRMHSVLYTTAEILRRISLLCQPFMPHSSSRMLDLLAVKKEERDFSYYSCKHALAAETVLPPPYALFPRYTEKSEER